MQGGIDISSPVLLDIEFVRHESYFGGALGFFLKKMGGENLNL